jgi:S-adenosylmethionine:tRNA ribosyltransferase-isomerase
MSEILGELPLRVEFITNRDGQVQTKQGLKPSITLTALATDGLGATSTPLTAVLLVQPPGLPAPGAGSSSAAGPAPTAGLHFDQAFLQALRAKGVRIATITLHVGAGTFQPVRTENLSEHQMHSEWYSISQETVDVVQAAQRAGKQIVAVGTTSLRALESASVSGTLIAGSNDTRLFITPGYTFHTVTRLITNFHLPKSTLLMLVSAFAGYQKLRDAYAHAIEQRYRFFSYGDAMLLERIANS